MAITTCRKLRIHEDRIRVCGLKLETGVKTVSFNPVTASLEELLLCPTCQEELYSLLLPYFNSTVPLSWPREQPILGSDGYVYRTAAVRKFLQAIGLDDFGGRGALSSRAIELFENISAEELRKILAENPEFRDLVISRAPVEDAALEARD